MFSESVCPFSRLGNVDVQELNADFTTADFRNGIIDYEDKIIEGTRERFGKCFLMPDYSDFEDFSSGVRKFSNLFKGFMKPEFSSEILITDNNSYHWFAVSNLYPDTYFRYMPKNMIVFTNADFFIGTEDVFSYTLKKAVIKSLGFNPFLENSEVCHKAFDDYPLIINDFKRLISIGLHNESEPLNFHYHCETLVRIMEDENYELDRLKELLQTVKSRRLLKSE